MNDLEKKIVEGAKLYDENSEIPYNLQEVFIEIVKSPEAKAYWYDKFCEEVVEPEHFVNFAKVCASRNHEENSAEWTTAYKSILFGMGCSLTREYWQEGMYTEEDVKNILEKISVLIFKWSGYKCLDVDIQEIFEQSKKK